MTKYVLLLPTETILRITGWSVALELVCFSWEIYNVQIVTKDRSNDDEEKITVIFLSPWGYWIQFCSEDLNGFSLQLWGFIWFCQFKGIELYPKYFVSYLSPHSQELKKKSMFLGLGSCISTASISFRSIAMIYW